MNKTEEILVKLVRLHYAAETRSFDQLIRNLASGRGRHMSIEALVELRNVIPDDVQMGSVLR